MHACEMQTMVSLLIASTLYRYGIFMKYESDYAVYISKRTYTLATIRHLYKRSTKISYMPCNFIKML